MLVTDEDFDYVPLRKRPELLFELRKMAEDKRIDRGNQRARTLGWVEVPATADPRPMMLTDDEGEPYVYDGPWQDHPYQQQWPTCQTGCGNRVYTGYGVCARCLMAAGLLTWGVDA